MLEKHGEITEETPPEGLQKTAKEKVNHATKRASDAAREALSDHFVKQLIRDIDESNGVR